MGGLPVLFSNEFKDVKDKNRFLKSYIFTYLKEEILIEQIVRNIDPFHLFLEISAQMNGEILNYSKIARFAGSNNKSVERYYSILVDTLFGFFLLPYNRSVRKRQISSSKFYYFDIGIIRTLKGHINKTIVNSTYEYGKLFESFIISEIYKINKYLEKDYKLFFLKTKDGVEIDLIIENHINKTFFIEIKSGEVNDLDSFNAKYMLSKDVANSEFIILSQNKSMLSKNNITVMPWQSGIKYIFDEEKIFA